MGNGKAIAKNRFSSDTGNRQLYLRIFCFCIILLYTQRRKHVCFASPFLCCFSPDETEKPKQHMLSGSSSFLAPFTCSYEDVKPCYFSANIVRSENPRTQAIVPAFR